MENEKPVSGEFNGEYPDFFETHVYGSSHLKLTANKIADDCYQLVRVFLEDKVAGTENKNIVPIHVTYQEAVLNLLNWEEDFAKVWFSVKEKSTNHVTKYASAESVFRTDAIQPPGKDKLEPS